MFYEARSQFSIAEVNYIFKEIENLDCKINGTFRNIPVNCSLKNERYLCTTFNKYSTVSNELTSQQ